MGNKKYSDEVIARAVAASTSISGVLRFLGIRQGGGSHQHLRRRIDRLGLDTSHFLGNSHRKNVPSSRRKSASEILVRREAGSRQKVEQLRRAMIEVGIRESCDECGLGLVWNGKPIVLQIDHMNGNWLDDRLENLRFLCPNCHTQTLTWKNRTRNDEPSEKRKLPLGSPIKNVASTQRTDSPQRSRNKCLDCGNNIHARATRCRKCSQSYQERKIDWPHPDVIIEAITSGQSFTGLAKQLGVSDNAIRKHLLRSGYEIPKYRTG